MLKESVELKLQKIEGWVALERRSKGNSMTIGEVQHEFGTTLTSERTGGIRNPGRLEFEVVEVDWFRDYSRWDICQDGKNIGGFWEWHVNVYEQGQVIFIASDPIQIYREARELSTHKIVRSVESDTGGTFYYPCFNTLAELLDYIELQQKTGDRY